MFSGGCQGVLTTLPFEAFRLISENRPVQVS